MFKELEMLKNYTDQPVAGELIKSHQKLLTSYVDKTFSNALINGFLAKYKALGRAKSVKYLAKVSETLRKMVQSGSMTLDRVVNYLETESALPNQTAVASFMVMA